MMRVMWIATVMIYVHEYARRDRPFERELEGYGYSVP